MNSGNHKHNAGDDQGRDWTKDMVDEADPPESRIGVIEVDDHSLVVRADPTALLMLGAEIGSVEDRRLDDIFAMTDPRLPNLGAWRAGEALQVYSRSFNRLFLQHTMMGDGEPSHIILTSETPFARNSASDSRDRLLARIAEDTLSEIYVMDAESKAFLLVNKHARRNLGFTQTEICRMQLMDIVTQQSAERWDAAFFTLAAGVDEVAIEARHRRRDGSTYPLEGRLQAWRLNGRDVLFAILTDMSAINQMRAKADLGMQLERAFRNAPTAQAALEQATDCLRAWGGWTSGQVICFDEDRNPAAAEIGGGDASFGDESGPRLNPTAWASIQTCRETGQCLQWVNTPPTEGNLTPLAQSIGFAAPVLCRGSVHAVIALLGCEGQTPERWPGDPASIVNDLSQQFERKQAEEELAEAHDRFDAAIEGARIGLWQYNYQTEKFYLSPRAQKMLGASAQHPTPGWMEFGARLHPDDIDRTRAAISNHIALKQPYQIEYRYRRPDGEYVWLQVRGRGRWDEAGRIIRTAGTLMEITTQKEAEFLRRDIASAMAADVSTPEKVAEVLERACRYLRMSTGVVGHVADDRYQVLYSTSEDGPLAKGKSYLLADVACSDVYPGEGVQAFANLGASPLSTHPVRGTMGVEAYIGAPVFVKGSRFGTLCFVSSEARTEPFPEAKIGTVRLLAQWIGDEIGRASFIADLVASEARKSANLASVGEAVLTINGAGCIEDVNPAASTLFGWDSESLRRMHIGQLLPTVGAFSTAEGGVMPLRSRQDIAIRRNGERFTILLQVSDVHLIDRTLSTVVVTDLTAVKQAEAAKRDFVSVVSHELRTPLTSIRGALALIAAQTAAPLPANVAALVQIARKNSDRLVRLVNDILDMEKLEAGKFEVSLRPVVLGNAIAEAVAVNQAYAERFGVSFATRSPPYAQTVVVDPDRLLQVMTNLLSNAAKFTRPGSVVTIESETIGEMARVSVRDQGQGVPESLRPQLFEKFAQAANVNTRDREGSGLGLSISRSLMRLMNGDIGYAFEPGVGSTFFIDLPLSASCGPTAPALLPHAGEDAPAAAVS